VVSRSDKFTIHDKKIQQFSDFTTSFAKNPLTGFLARVTNEDAIKQSIKNLVLTERTERFYRPWIGSKIMSLLFEPMDTPTQEMMKNAITETIKNNEPRVDLKLVEVIPHQDINAYVINVHFKIKNIPDSLETMNLILRRTR